MPPVKLTRIYHKEFKISRPVQELEALLSGTKSTLNEFCEYLSLYAQRETIKTVKLFGKHCQKASIFKTLLVNLKQKGFHTSGIKPSSKLNPIFLKNGGSFITEVNKLVPGVIPTYEYEENSIVEFGIWVQGVGLLALIIGLLMWKVPLVLGFPFIAGFLIIVYGQTKSPRVLKLGKLITFRDLINEMDRHFGKF